MTDEELHDRIAALEGGFSEAARLYHQGHESNTKKPWTECTKAVHCRDFQRIMAGEWAFSGKWVFERKRISG